MAYDVNTKEKTMEKKFIMTAFGKDRPGIVADVSQIIYGYSNRGIGRCISD